MEYLLEYGMFLAKVATVVVALVFLTTVIVHSSREIKPPKKGRIRVSRVNGHYNEMRDVLRHAALKRHELKRIAKEEKRRKQAEAKEDKKAAQAAAAEMEEQAKAADAMEASATVESSAVSKETAVEQAAAQESDKPESAESPQDAEDPADESKPRRRVFVIDFKGDLAATEVRSLREEISAILSLAGPQDETILRLESPGGTVHGYGLAASQLLRLRTGGVPLTICVDKVAASGGYLMACTADRLIAAPFAVIGSIGVLVQMPNFHRILKKNEVDFEMISAGEYKRTLSLFGEVTAKGRNKARQDVEEVHKLFKSWVKDNRPSLDVDSVSTGEIWLGVQARQQGMVDDLGTSDEYIVNACDDADVFEVEYEVRKSIQEKLAHTVDACASRLLSLFVERSRPENHWS